MDPPRQRPSPCATSPATLRSNAFTTMHKEFNHHHTQIILSNHTNCYISPFTPFICCRRGPDNRSTLTSSFTAHPFSDHIRSISVSRGYSQKSERVCWYEEEPGCRSFEYVEWSCSRRARPHNHHHKRDTEGGVGHALQCITAPNGVSCTVPTCCGDSSGMGIIRC